MAKRDQVFDTEPVFTLNLPDEPEKDTPADGKGGDDEVITAKQEDVDDLKAQIAELKRQSNDQLAAVLQTLRPQVGQGEKPAAVPTINFDGLPDPATDKDGYLKGVSERLNKAVQGAAEQAATRANDEARRQADQQAKINGLWSDFQDRFTDLKDYDELVNIGASRVAGRLRAKNLDVGQYVDTNRDQFLEDVATEVRKSLKKYGVQAGQATDADDGDEGRTAVLPAGGQGTSRGTKKAGGEKPALFTNEIKQIQKELGLF